MAHLGVLCPELSGHLNPMTSLARELARRGHRLTFYLRESGRERVERAGFAFRPFGGAEYPPEAVKRELQRLAELGGLKALRHTVEMFRKRSFACLRDVPPMVRADGVQALLVDQVMPEGSSVADEVGVPFATVCNALALHQEETVPPFCTTWRYGTGAFKRWRNRTAYRLLRRVVRPVVSAVNESRVRAGLKPYESFEQAHSSVLQISQQPPEFEFPDRKLPPHFHFTGPFVDPAARKPIEFDYDKLDGRPLIYASMGTLQNRQFGVFERIAAACANLPAQLIISLGGGATPDVLPKLPGDPIVVAAAPQLELLKRATLCVTHAGLNTALECLSEGVPMVAIPVTNDQPGVAGRLDHLGCAVMVPVKKSSVGRLRAAVTTVLNDPAYRTKVQRIRDAIRSRDGLTLAADLVERVLLRQPARSGNAVGA